MKISKLTEVVFDTLYLVTVLIISSVLILNSNGTLTTMYGIMGFTLLLGDSFHLIPRIIKSYNNKYNNIDLYVGIGKMTASITMTIFYVLLWHLGLIYFSVNLQAITILIYIISLTRIVICLLPGNNWIKEDSSIKWSLYRNIPFFILGAIVGIFFYLNISTNSVFNQMWLAVLLSFLFYIPVTIFAKKYPKIGMLMLPKSCSYVWILVMGLYLIN